MATSLVSTGVQFPDSTIQTTASTGGAPLNTQIFTSSGTWTKPASGTYVFIRLWASGGGGAKAADYASGPIGGNGGAFTCQTLLMADMPSTVSVTVGAGGAARTTTNTSPTTGNPSYFGTRIPVTSMVVNSNYVVADQAGTSDANWAAITRTNGSSGAISGDFTGAVFQCKAVGTGTGQVANYKVYAQAGLGYSGQFSLSSAYEGSTSTIFYEIISCFDRLNNIAWSTEVVLGCAVVSKGTNSFSKASSGGGNLSSQQFTWYAGGCGGGRSSGQWNSPLVPPGTSVYGGAGGAAGTGAVSGTNGTAPGGGGGATNTGATSGAGAAGRVEVYVF